MENTLILDEAVDGLYESGLDLLDSDLATPSCNLASESLLDYSIKGYESFKIFN